MVILNARILHNETSDVLDQVERGGRFQVQRNGKTIARLVPAHEPEEKPWSEIMAEVWEAQKTARGKSKNPVLAERQRKRR
jgi:antitoxin (DNA-binding transcriptional repressor) of toxin-antitoxin stability system